MSNVDIGQAFQAILAADADIAAAAGSRVFSDALPQRASVPAVVFRVISEIAYNALEGPLGMDQARIEVTAYGRTRPEANALAWHIWDGIAAHDPQTVEGVRVVAIVRDTGMRYDIDQAEAASDKIRFLTQQDFLVSYLSCELIP